MDPQGMVHALEEAHRLLKPEGILVDIHPLPEAPIVEVHHAGRSLLSEAYPTQGSEPYRQADQAIDLVVRRGLFVEERCAIFDFFTHAPSASDLEAYFTAANTFDPGPPDKEVQAHRADLVTRVDTIIAAAGPGSEVVLLERGKMASLRPVI
jgi:hypothetical protein